MWREFGEHCRRALAASRTIGDQADSVSALGLAGRDIADMAEQAADRRADDVEDAQRWRLRRMHNVSNRRLIESAGLAAIVLNKVLARRCAHTRSAD
jgi:hypothetical protein